ncbi:receptor kinase-like protein Xa21 [Magnolia sinica]|uniref:receptor kinase-like protein Xa21 n=1 Tax=Magnolia sinica TaxID=86752 RepID=UPI0026596406|nr:receptor kinase-like protein Xa21 [Magnolia sinica]
MGAKASTEGDVYSYGILLLEMITGKGPTDDMFKDDLSLHHFAKLSLPEQVMDIVYPVLLEEAKVTQGSGNHTNTRKRMHACLISMVRIGVLCSTESPRERMEMKDVVKEMHAIKDLYLGNELSSLRQLIICNNRLSGVLPDSMVNLSTQLTWLNIGSNRIFENIPSRIQNLVGLTALKMGQNFLTGNIPIGVGKLNKVEVLHLDRNELSSQIPSSLGYISRLFILVLSRNNLTGRIPSSLRNCNLPVETGNLKSLQTLNVSNNKLSREIPSLLGNCLSLEYLWLDGRFFQGSIPSAFSTLRGLQSLNLSCNILFVKIPQYLENLSAL